MIIFEDIISGDELCSDAYDMISTENGVLYEVDAQMITIKDGDVDIGANPSAEDGDQDYDDADVTRVLNVVHSFDLQDVAAYDKKTYMAHLKDYFKSLAKILPAEEFEDFKVKAGPVAKKIAANIKDYDFFTGSSMNPSAMVILRNYREDGITPYFIFWKAGLKGSKV